MEQQIDIRQGLNTFADTLTGASMATNATWPFFVMPNVEVHAGHMLAETNMEIAAICNIVWDKDRLEYEEFVRNGYLEWVEESHMDGYGNLDKLMPVGFAPVISVLDAEGKPIPEKQKDYYTPVISFSPP